MIASLGESLAITAVLAPLWVGVALLGVFYTVGGSGWEKVGGYVTMASAFTAFYAATAMMLLVCSELVPGLKRRMSSR